jgi:hypothetical protein
VPTPKGSAFTSSWTLGALLVEVLRPGGGGGSANPFEAGPRGAPRAARLFAPPRTERGAAALAGGFCVTLIALTAVMSRLNVGVAPGPPLEKVRSGTPEGMEMAGLISVQVSASGSALQTGGAAALGASAGGGAAPRPGAARVSVSASRRRVDAP